MATKGARRRERVPDARGPLTKDTVLRRAREFAALRRASMPELGR